jgi:hypothetical protein
MGLANAHLDPWGPFGRGWSQEHVVVNVTSPQRYALTGYSKAWTPGTNGPVSGEAVMVTLATDEDLQKWKGKLKGKFVLLTPPREAATSFQPAARRLTDVELGSLAQEPEPGRPAQRIPTAAAQQQQQGDPEPQAGLPLYMSPPDPGSPPRTPPTPGRNPAADRAFVAKRMKFLVEEGVLAVLEPGRGDAGLFIVSSGGPRNAGEPAVVPQIVVAIEHYGRMARTLARNIPVTIEADVRNKFHDGDPMSYNVIADLPGTDLRNEVVMLGAHLDSWHSGTGATDNAAGSVVAMEAIRILKTSGVRLRRTVRIGLWSGEEEGLLGSRAYVKAHFADRATMKLLPEHGRISGYYNLDNGTGAIRGIYAQSNDAVIPIFESWCGPFRSLGVTTVSPRNTGSTDHVAFDDVGIPAFQFIQDPVDYQSRTHHTNVDTYERLVPGDLMKNSVVMATFVYQTANRPARLPRKPLPPPRERNRSTPRPPAPAAPPAVSSGSTAKPPS